MTVWVDAQLSPRLASWLRESFEIEAVAVRDLGFQDAEDSDIFGAAREATAIVLTKDRDFVHLVNRLGAPPQVLWVTVGNTSTAHLKSLLERTFLAALDLLKQGEPLVEITDAW